MHLSHSRTLRNRSAFFKDGNKVQATARSDSSGQCQIVGIDETVEYGRLLVTHDGYIEYNNDDVKGRYPPTQIELSPRYNVATPRMCTFHWSFFLLYTCAYLGAFFVSYFWWRISWRVHSKYTALLCAGWT